MQLSYLCNELNNATLPLYHTWSISWQKMSIVYETKLENFCFLRNSLFLHDDKPFRNTTLLKFYYYDLLPLACTSNYSYTKHSWLSHILRSNIIQCILRKQYYLEKWSVVFLWQVPNIVPYLTAWNPNLWLDTSPQSKINIDIIFYSQTRTTII